MNSVITQIARGKNRQAIGVFLAKKHEGKVKIGWSKSCKTDKFNKQNGLFIAEARAINESNLHIPKTSIFKHIKTEIIDDIVINGIESKHIFIDKEYIPNFESQYIEFIQRAAAYFKDVSADNFQIASNDNYDTFVKEVKKRHN